MKLQSLQSPNLHRNRQLAYHTIIITLVLIFALTPLTPLAAPTTTLTPLTEHDYETPLPTHAYETPTPFVPWCECSWGGTCFCSGTCWCACLCDISGSCNCQTRGLPCYCYQGNCGVCDPPANTYGLLQQIYETLDSINTIVLLMFGLLVVVVTIAGTVQVLTFIWHHFIQVWL